MERKKAIEVIKKNWPDSSFTLLREALETVIPELKESEDEMIRKKVIATIHLYYGEPLEDEAKEMIAWLEKQGKNNMGISEATKQELEDNLNKALEKETPESWNEFLEKQGEPAKLSEEEQNKFAKGVLTSCALSFINYLDAHKYKGKMCVSNGECEDIENAFHNAMWDRLHRYYCKYIEKQGEQKPVEWSEEDEIMYKGLHNLIYSTPYCDSRKELSAWLKSLKDRVQPKPQQEWDGKSAKIINDCISAIHAADYYSLEDKNQMEDWLKSLRPQSQWKPSDEQMDALESAIIDSISSIQKHSLESLYNELKKLF